MFEPVRLSVILFQLAMVGETKLNWEKYFVKRLAMLPCALRNLEDTQGFLQLFSSYCYHQDGASETQ